MSNYLKITSEECKHLGILLFDIRQIVEAKRECPCLDDDSEWLNMFKEPGYKQFNHIIDLFMALNQELEELESLRAELEAAS